MPNSDGGNAEIPDWQKYADGKSQTDSIANSSLPVENNNSNHDSIQDASRNELIEQAQEFLNDEIVRDASFERKVGFLQRKGLKAEEIKKLLGPASTKDEVLIEEETQEDLKTIHDTTQAEVKTQIEGERNVTPSSPPSSMTATTTTTPLSPSPVSAELSHTSRSARDIPPIVTYPEFLLKPQKPPPLVTMSRLVKAAYGVAGLSALTYAAGKYVVQPMVEVLTEARHDFADHTITDLEKLNLKLESSVSHVPYTPSAEALRLSAQHARDRDADDADSEASDPTELFHRDVATQTSPLIRSRSSSDAEFNSSLQSKTSSAVLDTHCSGLSKLERYLTELLHAEQRLSKRREFAKVSTEDLEKALTRLETSYSYLAVARDTYPSSSPYSHATNDPRRPTTRDIELNRFKAEIRGLKGVLLSSRNFPTASRVPAFSYGQR